MAAAIQNAFAIHTDILLKTLIMSCALLMGLAAARAERIPAEENTDAQEKIMSFFAIYLNIILIKFFCVSKRYYPQEDSFAFKRQCQPNNRSAGIAHPRMYRLSAGVHQE